VTVRGVSTKTLWIAVAGSDEGQGEARRELQAALRDPERGFREKVAAREWWGRWTRLSLPGDRRLQAVVDRGKQNILDLTRVAEDMEIRWTDQGTQFPPPEGTVRRARWVGAGYRTTRGCSRPTASTRPSRAWRWGSSSRSRTT
jgi:hypothetical protein